MTSNISSPRLTALLAALIAIFFVGAMDQAKAQQTWANASTAKLWSNTVSGQWAWNSSDWWANANGLLVFASSGSGNVTNNMTDWLNFNGLQFNSGAASFTISGNSIGLTNNGNTPKIQNSSANTQTISLNNIALRNVSEFNPVDGDLVINSANVYLDSDLRVWGNNGKTLWLNGVLSQAGTLGIQQNSTVVFQQTMTYSGQTFIHAGQLIISNGARAGTGNINLGGTNIAGNSATNAFYLGLASSSGGVTNTNQININAGGGASTIGANNTSGVNTFTGPIVLSTNLNINNGGGTLTMNGVISGTGFGITKQGAGILILSNGNSYTGPTTISAGTLRLGASDRISSQSAVSIASGATFDFNNFNDTIGAISGAGNITLGTGNITVSSAANSDFSGAITGSGTFTKTGANTLTLSGNSSTYSGAFTISTGAIRVGNADALGTTGASTTVSDGAALELTSGAGSEPISLTGSGISSGGALRNISGNNTVAGLITLSGGSRINSDSGTLTLDVASGNAITGTQNLTIGGAGNVTVNDNIGIASGTLTKDGNGILTLAGTQNYTGATTVTNGTLVVSGTISSAVGVGHASSINGSTLTGAGTVGATTINNNGRISPGNGGVGILTVNPSLTLNGGGSYLWEISSTNSGSAGTGWDLIRVNNAGTGDGTLNLPTSGSFTVNGQAIGGLVFDNSANFSGNYFQIIQAGVVTGSLGNLSFASSGLGSGSWTFATNTSGLFLNYAAPGATNVFNNSTAQDQGAANIIVGGNTSGQLATLTNQGGVTAVVVSNSAPITFTNEANSYSGTTSIEQGTLVTTVNAPNNANGAFGNSISTVDVGSANSGNGNAANLLIGTGGVTVGRSISIIAGGSGARTVGATNASGTATYSGNVLMNTNVALSASNAGATTLFSGSLSGAGAVSVAGNGTVVLSGANSYTNTTTIGSGSTLVAANNAALGGGSGGTVVSGGGTLALSNNITEDENISISGTGVGGNGALRNISGANTNTGAITVAANATISADTGTTLQLNNIDNGAANRQLTFSNAGTILVTGNFANMDTTSTFFKNGSGSLVISNTSANTGGAQLQLGQGAVTLAAGTYSTNNGTGTRALDLGLTAGNVGSTFETAFYVNSGVTMSNSIYVAGGTGARILGTQSGSGTATFNNEIYLDNTARLTAETGGTALFSGNFINGGSLVKVGGGSVVLGGNNAIGDVTISNGTLAITNGSAIPSASLVTIDSGATLSVLSTENMGRIAGSGIITVASGQTLTNTISDSATFGGQLQGAGVIRKAGVGSLTLTGSTSNSIARLEHEEGVLLIGANTGIASVYQVQFTAPGTKTIAASGATAYTLSQSNNIFNDFTLGEATVNTGKLTFSGGTYLGDELNSTRTLTVAANNNHEFSGGITGNRGIIKAGTGSLTLSGSNSFGNTFQLNEGTVLVGNNDAFGTGVVQVQFAVAGTKTIASASSTGYTITNSVNVFNDLNLGLASVGTGALNFSGTVFLGNEVGENRVITTAAGTGHTVSGSVTGNRGIVKQGAGTITLSGANTSSGGFYIDNGALNLNGGSLSFSTIDIGSGVDGDQDQNNATLRVTSGSYSTPMTVNAEGTPGDRTIQFANASGSATLSGGLVAEKTFFANVSEAAGTGVLSGAISGAGGLTKTGSGTLTLSGASANTYGGTTTVSTGVLNLAKSVSNAVNGNLIVGSGATDSSVRLLLSASDQVGSGSGQTVTLSGGTIARGGNVSEVFGNLNLTTASFLDYGAANDLGTIRFGTYTPSALLTVNNFLPGNKLQFGNTISEADLNNASLFAFSSQFTTGTEGGFFTITAIPEPSTYLAAAGLLALFLWPARRRLMKDAKSILGLRAPARERLEAYRQA